MNNEETENQNRKVNSSKSTKRPTLKTNSELTTEEKKYVIGAFIDSFTANLCWNYFLYTFLILFTIKGAEPI